MVILSHLLSLLNKPWTPKPRSTLFMGNRFPFSSKLISVSCFTVLHFFNIFGFTINFPHCYFFKYGSTTEHIKLKVILASVNRSITASLILEQFLQVGYLYFGGCSKITLSFLYLVRLLLSYLQQTCFPPIGWPKSKVSTHMILLPLENLLYRLANHQ